MHLQSFKRHIYTTIICLFAGIACAGTTHYVSTSGQHIDPFDTWAKAATNLQAAINSVDGGASDDIIIVSNGVYRPIGISNLVNRLFEIRSVNGAGVTIIDAQTNSRCVYITGSIVKLDGFTLMNGRAWDGTLRGLDGGAALLNNGPWLVNCYVKNSVCDGYGAGVAMATNAKIAYCTVVSNSAIHGASGVYVYGSGSEIHNSIIWSNVLNNVINTNIGTCAYTCTTPLLPGTGNKASDPSFVDSTNWLLKANSPCIDAGSSMIHWSYDAFKMVRPLDGNNDGTTDYDIGAQEYYNGAADSDGDGLPDWWELQYKTSLTVPDAGSDFDGDGAINFAEYIAGTDPQNGSSTFKILRLLNTPPSITSTVVFTSVTNRMYVLEGSSNFTNPLTWYAITTNMTGTGTNITASGTNRFFRARCYWTNYGG